MKQNMIRLLATISCFLLLSGCGKSADNVDNTTADGGTDVGKAMGRYIETSYDLPEDVSRQGEFTRLEDGSLILYDYNAGCYTSKDNGTSWEKQEDSWVENESYMEVYKQQITAAENGSAFMIYSTRIEDPQTPEEEFTTYLHYLYVDKEGKETAILTDMSYEKDNYISYARFYDNRLFGIGVDQKIYEIFPDTGTCEELFITEEEVASLCFSNGILIGISEKQAYLYDVNKKTLLEQDTVLDEFFIQNLEGINSMYCPVSITSGEEKDVIYLALQKGLYRHVIGGSVIEEVIDGTLSTFGDPSSYVMNLEVLESGDFLVQFSNAQFILYHYDETVPTVPEKQLKVYSLTDNTMIRQAIALYRKKNPDVMVAYEVGMEEEQGVTKEDAIKNLNTKMMSGTGPDILVLDDLPVRSYMEKGILQDLTPLVNELTTQDEYFENILKTFEENQKIPMIPVNFQIPMIVGDTDAIEKITDLKTLADWVEETRETNPDGKIVGIVKEEQALKLLGMVCASAWIQEDGTLNEAAIKEFLTQSKRIFQAEKMGITEQDIKDFENQSMASSSDGKYKIVTGEDDAFYQDLTRNVVDLLSEVTKISMGYVGGISLEFSGITSIVKERGNTDYKPFDGQLQNVFLPNTFIGMFSNAVENDAAKEFIQLLLSKECQSTEMGQGFSVNKTSFKELLYASFVEPGEIFGAMGYMTFDGVEKSMDCYWPTQEELDGLTKMVEDAKTPCTVESLVRETVYEIGQKALSEELSIDEAVNQIIKESKIYLSE